ncbi:MAG: Phosphoglycerate mutase [uncultured bacterium]|nr:MAG: Phosphoglycerate mutase [uncultured bacterium]
MTKIILIRHGETQTNVKNILHKYGDPDNLTPTGIKQVELVGERLKTLGLEKLYASNEYRALQSADIIGKICNLDITPLEGMEERNWGEFSGKPWSDVKVVLDPLTLDQRFNYIPPNGESWKTVEERLITAVKKAVELNPKKTVGIVTHAGSIRALIPFLLKVPREESFKYDPKNTSITIVEIEGDSITPILIDDTSHLPS